MQSRHSKSESTLPFRIQYEAALAVDSVRLIAIALSNMVTKEPTIFRQTLRHGKFYNNGTEGIDCDAEPVQTWRHGHEIMKVMRDVSTNWLYKCMARVIKIDSLSCNVNSTPTKPRFFSQFLLGVWQILHMYAWDWCSELGYVLFEFALQPTFGAKTVY